VTTGSDAQKRAYVATLARSTNLVVSFALLRRERSAELLAATAVLRRKGRSLDAMASSLSVLRARLGVEERALLDQLDAARARYIAITLRGPGPAPLETYLREVAALDEQAQSREAAISERSKLLRRGEQAVTAEAVQSALPDDAALVEWAIYQPIDPRTSAERKAWGAPRYAAGILPRHGDPAWIDLGDAKTLDADVQALRDALARPASKDTAKLARALEARVMAPVLALLGDTHRVFLSPDGALNLIPFAALLGEDGRPLVERYAFTYLTSGRDLLRRRFHTPVREPPFVVTAPDFDLDEPAGTPFPALLHAGDVGDTLAACFRHPAPVVVSGREATKARLQQVHGPQFLHLGSHGYFDSRVCTLSPSAGLRDNPLLRSGIALAGANACTRGEHDGLLTASEASGLDLYGTRLVVLAACESGVGEASAGDGVYGLRRALVLSGAETQVMSLWRVDEGATGALMKAYYEGLARGGGRSEAMRQAQLAMMHDGRHEHPFYWASFIVSGDDRSLDGAPVDLDLRVRAHGACTCRVGERGSAEDSAWVVALTASLMVIRRARRGPPRRQSCRAMARGRTPAGTSRRSPGARRVFSGAR
jgi:CHAT domain-containing protein